MPLSLSCVSFLNALPYVEGIRRLPEAERPTLFLEPPFLCAERLARGGVDAALVPSIEYARLPGALPVNGFGIASRREVRSVILLARKPLGTLRTVAVDSNSRTSVALVRILLARIHGIRPRLVAMPPAPKAMLEKCDAALLIGDAALASGGEGAESHDLASLWHSMTGMPFVFAVWAARRAEAASRTAALLENALSEGMRALPEAAASAARGSGRSAAEIETYLTANIHFRLGDEEGRSLEHFLSLCREEGMLARADVAGA